MAPRGLKRGLTFLGAVAIIMLFSLGYLHINMTFISSMPDNTRLDDHREHRDIKVRPREKTGTVLHTVFQRCSGRDGDN